MDSPESIAARLAIGQRSLQFNLALLKADNRRRSALAEPGERERWIQDLDARVEQLLRDLQRDS